MISKKIYHLARIFFLARWSILPPKKVDIVLFDEINNPFLNFLNKKKYSTFCIRNEEINLYVLFVCILKLKINRNEYIKVFFNYANPKIILTAIDNSKTFLELKDYLNKEIKIISIQNAYRTYWGDLLDLEKNFNIKKKKFKVDLMFVFNKKIKEIYSKYIDGEKIIIGAYTNNERKKKILKKKKEILFISTHKPFVNLKSFDHKVSNYDFFKNDKKVLERVLELCKKFNLKLNILGRITSKKDAIKEYAYFKNILKNNFNFIKNERGQNNHSICDKYKYVITIDSTLGVENLSRGGRTIFISSRPKKYPAKTRAYGNLEGLKSNGNYWCYFNSKKNFDKVFYNLIKEDNKFWSKCIAKNRNSIMKYDPGNIIFENKINSYLKK